MDKELRIEFERVAANGGYSMDRTNDGAYEDQWLQNAREILSMMNIKSILRLSND